MATKNVQLKNGGGDLLMPKTDAENVTYITYLIKFEQSNWAIANKGTHITTNIGFELGKKYRIKLEVANSSAGLSLYLGANATTTTTYVQLGGIGTGKSLLDVIYTPQEATNYQYPYTWNNGTATTGNLQIWEIVEEETVDTALEKKVEYTTIEGNNVQLKKNNGDLLMPKTAAGIVTYDKTKTPTLGSGNVQTAIETLAEYHIDYAMYIEFASANYGKKTGAVWEYDGDVYTVMGSKHLYVYKNGTPFYSFTNNITTFNLDLGCCGYGKYVYWATISTSSDNYTWTLHSLDIETKARVSYTDTAVRARISSGNGYNGTISFHAFNGKLYATIGCAYGYQTTVDLYEITETGFSYVNNIFTAGEEWGKKISNNESVETNGPSFAKLSDDGSTLYCEIKVDRGGMPFVKKLVDNAWVPYSIFSINGGVSLTSDFTITPKGRIFHVEASGLMNWLDVTCNHVFQINISNVLSGATTAIGTISGCMMFWLTDALYVFFTTNSGSFYKIAKVKKDYIDNIMDGAFTKEIVTTDASILSTLKTGEAALLIGGNNTITEWSTTNGSFPARAITVYKNFHKDSIWRVIYRGVSDRYIFYPISYGEEKFSTIPFRSIAYYNPFYSGGFRIPCLDFYKDKFYAMCAARYFTGSDNDPAESVLCKSTNNGHEWKDYVKAMPIITGEGSAEKRSSMDAVMLIDKYASSPHVGRIWVFSRDDNSNFVDANQTTQYVRFIMRYSDDDGATWSEPIDLTDTLLAEAPSNVKIFVPGESAGITLANGTLVLPIYYTTTASGYNPYAGFIYSTDSGSTWHLGDIASIYSDESVIIQKEDGTLVMSSRARYDNNQHLFFSLSSIGSGWQQIQNTNFTSYTCCYGFGYCNGIYVISAPANSGRQNITVYASKDLANWKKIVQISSGSGASTYGYSQLVFNQNTLAVLFENKSKDIEFVNLKEYLPSVFGV